MKVVASDRPPDRLACDVLAVPVKSGKPLEGLQPLDDALGGWLREAVTLDHFEGKRDTLLQVFTHGRLPAARVLLVGTGAAEDLTDASRRAAAAAARHAQAVRARRLGLWPGAFPPTPEVAAALVEGALLGAYRYTRYKPDPTPSVESVEVVGVRGAAGAVRRARVLAEATYFARDLVNGPPNEVNPVFLARTARQLGRQLGLRVQVFGPPQLRRMGAGAILAVGAGSHQPPQMIVLDYRPPRARKTYVVVGKGVTFDAGGLDIKTHEGMETMKADMAGAAAVLACLRAAPALGIPHRVVGVVGAVENLLGGAAFKPGDVVRAIDGQTIEITNTDAEGRVVLADCLAYARRYRPDAVVDLATLTGAAMVALGYHAAAILGNDRDLVRSLVEAGQRAGERLWELPLYEEFVEAMRGEVAQWKNSGGRYGGAQKGAAFLRAFVGPHPWAHLDIAGVAFLDKPEGQAPHLPKGATGFGVRTLLRWLAEG
ncbi:MAG: leucyl aminopeptidase [bacterium]